MKISDSELLEAYYSAIELALDHEFIAMLEEEIIKRNLDLKRNKIVQK
ncbi:hypothetical protein JOC85_002372 [Bacillus mesophilus]|uniref:Sporulation histidine kinase inhibitor Sda n=1 Tax=Bacillus mesophilus TaxID=1808955 RepID=A0A6M0QB43_9BACI|nr:sporulation histidine kinase inhibitor Sda [Bacillus mesophilus]MBM7661569.1 hypothetical protein [Bacillus mesophilus]NEY72238.1 sporulation histidine kinase inhibitor Sda [Bacillus mesophilus]